MYTHCGELIDQILKNAPDVEVLGTQYMIDGVEAFIVDKYDKQEYVVTVQPRRLHENNKGRRNAKVPEAERKH